MKCACLLLVTCFSYYVQLFLIWHNDIVPDCKFMYFSCWLHKVMLVLHMVSWNTAWTLQGFIYRELNNLDKYLLHLLQMAKVAKMYQVAPLGVHIFKIWGRSTSPQTPLEVVRLGPSCFSTIKRAPLIIVKFLYQAAPAWPTTVEL